MFGDARDESLYTSSGMAVPAGDAVRARRAADPQQAGFAPGAGGEDYEEENPAPASEADMPIGVVATRLSIPDNVLTAFLDGMGATPDTSTANFAYVSEGDIVDMISKMTVDGQAPP